MPKDQLKMSKISTLPNCKKVVLKSRPGKDLASENFEIIEGIARAPEDGEILVEVGTLSVDAFIRTTLSENAFHGSTGIGDVITALGIGKVMISKSQKFEEGDIVSGFMGAQTHNTMAAEAFQKVKDPELDLPVQLGLLGLTGLTAYFGMLNVGLVKAGDTVLVSAAAGAVGSIACQIAKIKGAKVIGIAGGSEKCKYIVNDLGMDGAIDYKNQDVDAELKIKAPEGIDVYFDNVGGDMLDIALDHIKERARVVICGAISQYGSFETEKRLVQGPRLYLKLAQKYARMEGFTVMHFVAQIEEASKHLLEYYQEGKLKMTTHYEEGIESFPKALKIMFDGGHTGKLLVKM
jgi:NADPH-dependent curcumin reductase CurA